MQFSDKSLDAGRELVRKWGIDTSLEDSVISAETEILNNFDSMKYGIESAILSGKRARFLDEMDLDNIQMNCSEAGINMFLIMSSMKPREKIRLLMYNPYGGNSEYSYHFALLRFDRSDPLIVDPLMHKFGRIKFRKDGLLYIPNNYLNEIEDGMLPVEALKLNPEETPHIIKSDYMLLDEDDVLRYVHRMNTDLGFFDYFADGQRIKEVDDYAFNAEFSCQTTGDSLIVRSTFYTGFLAGVTHERIYTYTDDLHIHETRYLHLDMDWVIPKKIIYRDGVFYPPDKSDNVGLAYLSYIRGLGLIKRKAGRGLISTKKQRAEYFQKAYVENAHVTKEEKEHIDRDLAVKEFIESLPSKAASAYIDEAIFTKMFIFRMVKLRKPVNRPSKKENLNNVMDVYMQNKYEMGRLYIEDFFQSDVVKALEYQYVSAINMKRQIDKLAA